MKSQRTRRASRRSFIVLALSLSSLASVCALAWGVAHSQQAGEAQGSERKFENTVPEHVPIKVKLKSEKSFKDLRNKNWARELEVEVKNTGNKPIHYLYMIIDMPDLLLEDGISLSFRVKYGVNWLAAASSAPPPPDEAPIRPGESITLKIPEKRWKAFEALREKKKKNDPKKVTFELQLIDFGDGTALESPQGAPLSYPVKQSSFNNPPTTGGKHPCRPPSEYEVAGPSINFPEPHFSLTPASF